MHIGVEIAAYSSMVDWDSCAYLLFSQEEGIFRGRILQVGQQFLSGSFCYCGGEHAAEILCISCVFCTAFVHFNTQIHSFVIFFHHSLTSCTYSFLFTGSMHNFGYDCYLTPCSAFFLSYSSH